MRLPAFVKAELQVWSRPCLRLEPLQTESWVIVRLFTGKVKVRNCGPDASVDALFLQILQMLIVIIMSKTLQLNNSKMIKM